MLDGNKTGAFYLEGSHNNSQGNQCRLYTVSVPVEVVEVEVESVLTHMVYYFLDRQMELTKSYNNSLDHNRH
jgi:hypothetical protein